MAVVRDGSCNLATQCRALLGLRYCAGDKLSTMTLQHWQSIVYKYKQMLNEQQNGIYTEQVILVSTSFLCCDACFLMCFNKLPRRVYYLMSCGTTCGAWRTSGIFATLIGSKFGVTVASFTPFARSWAVRRSSYWVPFHSLFPVERSPLTETLSRVRLDAMNCTGWSRGPRNLPPSPSGSLLWTHCNQSALEECRQISIRSFRSGTGVPGLLKSEFATGGSSLPRCWGGSRQPAPLSKPAALSFSVGLLWNLCPSATWQEQLVHLCL